MKWLAGFLLVVTWGHSAQAGDELKLKVDAVIFDLGGVIVDLDVAAWRRRMTPIVGSMDNPRFQALFQRFERGKISIRAFRDGLRRLRPENAELSDRALNAAWGSMIGAVDCRKVALAQRVRREGIQTYVLSTTDRIHIELVRARLRKCLPKLKGDPFGHIFTRAFFTFDVGYLKPNPRIYRHVLAAAHIRASRTVFLDDSPANVLGAQLVGIRSLLIEGPRYLEWLPKLLGLPLRGPRR